MNLSVGNTSQKVYVLIKMTAMTIWNMTNMERYVEITSH